MAAISRNYLALESGQYKVRPSSSEEIIFTSVRIGGNSGKDITLVSGNFDFAAAKLVNLADPTSAQDAATKTYVDTAVDLVAAGYDPKASVDLATAAALPAATYANGTAGVGATLTADANGALTVDGVSVVAGWRILVKNQAAGLQNGIYVVTATGDGSNPFILTRATDFDNSPSGEVTKGARTLVVGGTANGGYAYFLTTAGTITIGTTALTFSPASASVVTATSGSGGGTVGVSTFDSDKGLAVVAGVAEVKIASDLKFSSGSITREDAVSKTNDNAGSITVRQIVYVKTNGNVDLATAVNATNSVELGVVSDASIATTASGKIYVRPGALITGFSGLTPGAHVYVHNSTAGAYTQDPSTISTGNHLYSIGRALSATEVIFNPAHIAEM